ncbi:hypothetical protein TSUD_302320 [Trifolium subterraneum]|uniref:Uncharacterized protein n=1 Tax=Trifolium subterraneum TaxID=3900 RepID=A0A2Z6PF44_TRISU|nr:hypothetical protein TSUD_302320 [Trifolium subterraneum]
MSMGSIYVAVPSLAAAVGFYFIGTNHAKDINKGFTESTQKMIPQVKDQGKILQKTKLAPQLDGLNCFETFVMN